MLTFLDGPLVTIPQKGWSWGGAGKTGGGAGKSGREAGKTGDGESKIGVGEGTTVTTVLLVHKKCLESPYIKGYLQVHCFDLIFLIGLVLSNYPKMHIVFSQLSFPLNI